MKLQPAIQQATGGPTNVSVIVADSWRNELSNLFRNAAVPVAESGGRYRTAVVTRLQARVTGTMPRCFQIPFGSLHREKHLPTESDAEATARFCGVGARTNREREKGFEPERTESTQWTESVEDHGPREARERRRRSEPSTSTLARCFDPVP